MNADVLREAAALMRDRADGVGNDGFKSAEDMACYACDGSFIEDVDQRLAGHYSSWHPAVALAVADWLEATAQRIDAGRDPKNGGRRNHGWRGSREALSVARTYLDGAA